MNRLALFVAQGFSIGRIPVAPGTFGSAIGLVWFALLLQTGSPGLFLLGTFLGGLLSVWLCGVGENILRKKDPGSVVLDEITAMPVCFIGYLGKYWAAHHSFPPLEFFFGRNGWYVTASIFVLFRIFDVVKPWPVRSSQALVGGWGITIDDFLAAGYVALISFVLSFILPWPSFRF
jgi:phosphatidylglycerophosphatase A